MNFAYDKVRAAAPLGVEALFFFCAMKIDLEELPRIYGINLLSICSIRKKANLKLITAIGRLQFWQFSLTKSKNLSLFGLIGDRGVTFEFCTRT